MKSAFMQLGRDLYLLLCLIAFMWIVEMVNVIFDHQISNALGVTPRDVGGLFGVIFAPFLHANISHLTANTLSFLILGALIMLRGRRDFVWVSLCTICGSGLGTWLVGQSGSVHVGASGLIFGYIGYLLAIGYFERSIKAMGIAIVVAFLYGGFFWHLLPIKSGVSWEMHLFGCMSGVWAALTMHRLLNNKESSETVPKVK